MLVPVPRQLSSLPLPLPLPLPSPPPPVLFPRPREAKRRARATLPSVPHCARRTKRKKPPGPIAALASDAASGIIHTATAPYCAGARSLVAGQPITYLPNCLPLFLSITLTLALVFVSGEHPSVPPRCAGRRGETLCDVLCCEGGCSTRSCLALDGRRDDGRAMASCGI